MLALFPPLEPVGANTHAETFKVFGMLLSPLGCLKLGVGYLSWQDRAGSRATHLDRKAAGRCGEGAENVAP